MNSKKFFVNVLETRVKRHLQYAADLVIKVSVSIVFTLCLENEMGGVKGGKFRKRDREGDNQERHEPTPVNSSHLIFNAAWGIYSYDALLDVLRAHASAVPKDDS